MRRQTNDRSLVRSWLKPVSLTSDGDDSVRSDLSPDPADDDLKRIEPPVGIALVDMIGQLKAAYGGALLLDQVT
jgi:hypothetical protein